ncbi:MAG: Asp23/Gls24 family envelope stress response protein [Opitutales bacterium]
MTEENEYQEPVELEPLEENSDGSITINNNVVANIVAMAAREVPGVFSLASGSFQGLFNKGGVISVEEDEQGFYRIRIKIILVFGVRIGKVAEEVKRSIKEQVELMTDKEVARVDIQVDEVRHPDRPKLEEQTD